MSPPPDPGLDELLVRYWDNALSPAEADELERRLASDPAARELFGQFALQAVAAGELSTLAGAAEPRRWSRRRVLKYAAGGLAAGVAAAVLARPLWRGDSHALLRVADARGAVWLTSPDGPVAARGGAAVPPGTTVGTRGLGSSAVLAYADGTRVALAGDSVLVVAESGRQLQLRLGNATADVAARSADGAPPLVLGTAVATLTSLAGASVALSQATRATEVGVRRGRVTVSTPAGEELAVVRAGEHLTVRPGGDCHKEPLRPTPDEFAWDLTRPLPEGWPVGHREVAADGPVIVPDRWPDPYYNGTPMYQIRSDGQWMSGFFRAEPDSVVRVRYQVDRPGKGQVCFCARTADAHAPDTGMLEWNGTYEPAAGGGWSHLAVRAGELLDNKNAPKFGPPWVGFLVIFNTYTADLGLRVAEFRVGRPGGAAR